MHCHNAKVLTDFLTEWLEQPRNGDPCIVPNGEVLHCDARARAWLHFAAEVEYEADVVSAQQLFVLNIVNTT